MPILTSLQLVLTSVAALTFVLCALVPLEMGPLISYDTRHPAGS